ncbi:MAG TPA: GNAT family N-acetyltransferase [Polyangiaceae bacterium LLY-WYZ-15_(1-7)]|nr:hypothetical protein [Myxococcales bacterium]MAT27375.1 hypothetical protein [Sandaracinus sp.]HJL04822.1 GNAT family N-acetyltransferase [Polyangiaceae bacterium LLY-WYZ-15_(1-7)]MBJ72489.1 hypothetical protein [Sandaracinus sp.]HJL09935.1 GNAT family N-acetyltransferase [Polyangiaceae bacterium LLY-WYZ-15_(1-7)]
MPPTDSPADSPAAPRYRVAEPADRAALSGLMRWSFRKRPEEAERWLDWVGPDAPRVLELDGEPAASALVRPAGLFLGGRRVSTQTVAAVATDPVRRGRGAARALVEGVLREAADRGLATATLYPSTRRPYRRVGFGVAGVRYGYRVGTAAMRPASREAAVEVAPLRDEDLPARAALRRRLALEEHGPLERDGYWWRRLSEHPTLEVRGFALRVGERLVGWVHLAELPGPAGSFRYDLRVTDYGCATAGALRALRGFLAGHRSLADHVSWSGGPADPLCLALDDATYEVSQSPSHWMLRVVDARAALVERGWPTSVRGELGLRLRDPLLPRNEAPFTVRLRSGAAEVEEGARGPAAEADVETFASIYTGLLSPRRAAALGRLTAPDAQLDLMEEAFRSPTPWMSEAF